MLWKMEYGVSLERTASRVTDHEREIKRFISILMESPLYMTLSLKERQTLLERLTKSYPFFEEGGAGKEDNSS